MKRIMVVVDPVAVVDEAFWLAWKACGGPVGLGILQDRSGVTKEQVLRNVRTSGDYPSSVNPPSQSTYVDSASGHTVTVTYGDYVFGRMMKLSLHHGTHGIIISDRQPKADYQAWCRVYPTYEDLLQAAAKSLGVCATIEEEVIDGKKD